MGRKVEGDLCDLLGEGIRQEGVQSRWSAKKQNKETKQNKTKYGCDWGIAFGGGEGEANICNQATLFPDLCGLRVPRECLLLMLAGIRREVGKGKAG